MEIKYLKAAEKAKEIHGRKNKPATIEKITQLESQAGVNFPIAYIEFLFLCGNSASMLSDFNHEITEAFDRQAKVQELLDEVDFKLEKPYWVIGDLDGGYQFYFFYFGDGKDPENPPVYICDRPYWEEGEMGDDWEYVRKMSDSFSSFIEGLIKYRKSVGY